MIKIIITQYSSIENHPTITGLQYVQLDIILMLAAKFCENPTIDFGDEARTSFVVIKNAQMSVNPGKILQYAQLEMIQMLPAQLGENLKRGYGNEALKKVKRTDRWQKVYMTRVEVYIRKYRHCVIKYHKKYNSILY